MAPIAAHHSLVILYGIGGLSDVGRHAILAALEQPTVDKITVITEYPELLDEPNWECNCEGGHTNPLKDAASADKINLVKVDHWKEPVPNLAQHFEAATAVISCLGHRQPGVKYPQLITRGLVAKDGNEQVIQAMKSHHVQRAVVSYKDLLGMEQAYQESDIDYLFIRPTGLGEGVVPVGKAYVQEKKGVDVVGLELAKIDCARYMVQEAIHPTRSGSIVVGSEPAASKKN